jgi:Ni/Co efflux regulator RcnB
MSKVVISNAATGETIEREMTVDEQAKRDAENAEWQAGQQARAQAAVDAQRHAAYVAESDPLFFQWQRGETTEQQWRDKVAEIRTRYPDPA